MNRVGVFIFCLLSGLGIFTMLTFLMDLYKIVYMFAIMVVFLLVYLYAIRNETLKEYRPLLLAFFLAALVILLQLPWSSGTTIEEIVINKIISSILVVVPIILAVKLTSGDMDDLYLRKGNLRQGIIIGSVTILVFAVTAIPASIYLFGGQEVSLDRLIFLIPWITTFVLVNGVREELLFRGLFLKKYESFFTPDRSNLLQAIIFSFAHLQAVFTPFVLIYLILTLFLGLGFGAVMQRTDSLLGSVLFHAAADIPVILAVFSFL